jgi:polyhydroxyalkanoate synthesis regulator phasin
MRKITIAVLAIVLAGAALVGGGIGLVAAQSEDDPVQTFLGRVAEKLGIGEDELRSAMTEAQQDAVDEQVAEGKLTAEQGERLKERIQEEGLLGPAVRDRIADRIRDRVREHDQRLTMEAAATVLGMEPEELLDQLKDGKTLAEAAEAQGMAVDEFKTALLAQVQQELDALVAEGKLTEEQAETIYGGIEENIDRIVNAQPVPSGPRFDCHCQCGPLGGPSGGSGGPPEEPQS